MDSNNNYNMGILQNYYFFAVFSVATTERQAKIDETGIRQI